jgi:hypothetical protein
MLTALVVSATVPLTGLILFVVVPRLERWLDDEPTARDDVPAGRPFIRK